MKKPIPPTKPSLYYYKQKKKIVIEVKTLKTIGLFILISVSAFFLLKIVMDSNPNTLIKIIIGFVSLPVIGLVLYVPFLFFSLFSTKYYRKEIRKNNKLLRKEKSQYESEFSLYTIQLEEYNKIQEYKKIKRQKKLEQKRKEEAQKRIDQDFRLAENSNRIVKTVIENRGSNKDDENNNENNSNKIENIVSPLSFENEYYKYRFQIESTELSKYKWYAIWYYFPVSRFSAYDISAEDLINRNQIFNFKDGKDPIHFSKILAAALINKFGLSWLKNKTLVIIPASSESRTETRFKIFCEKLSLYTGMKNGYDIIVNNGVIRKPKNQGGDRNQSLLSSIKLNGSISDKNLIIIDDIRTMGKSSNDIYEILLENGASQMIFVYFGRTVSL